MLKSVIKIFVLVLLVSESIFAAKLYNYKMNKVEIVDDELVNKNIISRTHSFLKGDTIHVFDDNGGIWNIPAEKARGAIIVGYRYASEDEIKKYMDAKPKSIVRKNITNKNKYKFKSRNEWIYTYYEPDLLTLENFSNISLLASKVKFYDIDFEKFEIIHFIRLVLVGNGSIYIDWLPSEALVNRCDIENGIIRLSYRVDKALVKTIIPLFTKNRTSITFLPKDKIISDNLLKSKEFVAKFECWSKKYVLKPQISTRYNSDASRIYESAQRMACHIQRPEPFISPECYYEQLSNISWSVTSLFNTIGISKATQTHLIDNLPSEFPIPESYINLSGELY